MRRGLPLRLGEVAEEPVDDDVVRIELVKFGVVRHG
jgi:hypothetical protein